MPRKPLADLDRPVRRVAARRGLDVPSDHWPHTIPAVRHVLTRGLELGDATILVGENGSGKSTLVEAIAEAYGLNPEGGSTGAQHATRRTESHLSADLQLTRGAAAARGGYFLRAETMHAFFTYLEESGFGDNFHERSHGESFLELMDSRFRYPDGRLRPGLYVLDEPESALSFSSSLRVLSLLIDMVATPRVQLLMATHSPVLSALPRATVYELGDAGLTRTPWENLELVASERLFLADPAAFLRHLVST